MPIFFKIQIYVYKVLVLLLVLSFIFNEIEYFHEYWPFLFLPWKNLMICLPPF